MLEVLLYSIKRIGLSSTDSSDERVLKKNLATIIIALCVLSVIWGLIYMFLGLYFAGCLAFTFTIFSVIALVVFSRTKKRKHLLFIGLSPLFFLSFFVQINLGGMQNSGFITLWSVLCPIGFLLFQSVRSSVYWFILYVLSTIIVIYFDDYISSHFLKNVPLIARNMFRIMNIICVISVVFFALLYYVSESENEKRKNRRLLDLAQKHRTEIELKNKELEKSLMERDVLLKEIHHRVKNNMQVITSLLSLQASYITDEKTKALFRYSQYRIASMAIVHEMLYRSKDLGQIKYADYLRRLVDQLIVSMKGSTNNIKFRMEVPEISLNIDTAIPLGLMINEIITNSLKYGFKGLVDGEIYIRIEDHQYGNYTMFIGDNGIGFPETISFRESETLGILLMHNLSLQLQGGIEKLNEQGTHYIINFKEISQPS